MLLDRFSASWKLLGIIAAVLGVFTIVLAAPSLAPLSKNTGKKPLQNVIEKVASLDPALQSKICAHRTNSIPKYRAALALFDCVEIDVVIQPPIGNFVAVYHPPVENHIGLSLSFLLQHEPLPDGRLWLDVKDLSASNWEGFLRQVNEFVPQNRRGDVVIETDWRDAGVERAVRAFREAGYLVSYYLPTESAIECGTAGTATCNQLRADVLSTTSLGFSHLSFDAQAYPFVSGIRNRLPSSLRLLTWDGTPAWPQVSLLRDVDIYIIWFPGHFST